MNYMYVFMPSLECRISFAERLTGPAGDSHDEESGKHISGCY